MSYLGDFPTGATVYVPFHTFNAAGASVTLTGLAVTDIEIYKNGGTTQRSSEAGYTLLDTDGIDFDGTTGIHGFSIDLSDNTDADFYAAGSEYIVVVASVTVDSQTVNFVAATFSVERAGGALALLKNATYGLSAIEALVDDLESRLTAARAGYLDNINNVALSTTVAQTGDSYAIVSHADYGNAKLVRSTTPANTLDVSATGEAGLDFDNIKVATAPSTLTNITVPTVTTLTGHTAQTGDSFARLGAPSGVSVSADIADIPTVAEFEARTLVAADYVVVGDTLAAVTTVGSVTAEVIADMVKISGDATAADRLEATLDAMPSGAVVDDNDPDPTTTAFETNLSEATDDHYNGAFVVFTSGALLGQSRKISDYDGTTKIVTVATAFTEAPAAADTFIILGRSE